MSAAEPIRERRGNDDSLDIRTLAHHVIAQAFRDLDGLAGLADRLHVKGAVGQYLSCGMRHSRARSINTPIRWLSDDLAWIDDPNGYWLWATALDLDMTEADAIAQRFRKLALPVLARLEAYRDGGGR